MKWFLVTKRQDTKSWVLVEIFFIVGSIFWKKRIKSNRRNSFLFSNIIGTSFVPKERFPLSPGEIVSLPLLESFCKSKGLIVKRCKSACFVRLGEYSLSIYSNGTVGRCYVSGGQEKVFSFDEADLVNFFWKNFAVNCLKKKGED